MVRPIMKDPIFLGRKSEEAGAEDLPIAADLLDTLKAHASECVGMAANMIGQAKRIIVFDCDGSYMTMFNPEILRTAQPFQAEEGCLSLTGTRKTTRFRTIKVRYQNESFQTRIKTFTGWTAQAVQRHFIYVLGALRYIKILYDIS